MATLKATFYVFGTMVVGVPIAMVSIYLPPLLLGPWGLLVVGAIFLGLVAFIIMDVRRGLLKQKAPACACKCKCEHCRNCEHKVHKSERWPDYTTGDHV